MNTTDALRNLVGVCRAMDHEQENERPTEEAYQQALAQADSALQLRDGTAVDLRAPWPVAAIPSHPDRILT